MANIRDLLLDWSEAGDRDDPPVFAGREDIIARVLRATRRLPPGGGRGKTFLVEGAPGAGKTALVSEIAKRFQDLGGFVVVCPSVPNERDVELAYSDLASALAGVSPTAVRTTTHGTWGGGARIAGIGGERRRGETVAPPRIRSPKDIAALRRDGTSASDVRAIVFVDEIQNIEPNTAASAFVEAMHTQQSIPALLVCAGLSTSRGRLMDAGLSRLSLGATVRLGALSPREALDCARRTLERIAGEGLPASRRAIERWANSMAVASDGWPRHLQSHLNACWTTLLEQPAPSLDTADLEAAIRLGNSLRSAYYDERIVLSRASLGIVGALHARLAEEVPIDELQATSIVGEAINAIDDPTAQKTLRERFPTNEACFQRFLQVGIVALDDEGNCVSPIPSLSRHILDRCAASGGKVSHPE